MNLERERELFLEWHFNEWKINNSNDESIEFAKMLYERVYSHDHTSCVRDIEFKAWLASASREGYKLVPTQATNKIMVAIESKVENQLQASGVSQDPFRLDGETIYESMLGAVE